MAGPSGPAPGSGGPPKPKSGGSKSGSKPAKTTSSAAPSPGNERDAYLNVLRRIFRTQSPPISGVTNKLIDFAIKHRMSAADFLYLYRARDPNYVKSFEFRVRYRDAVATARRMLGPDAKVPKSLIQSLVLSEAGAQEFENKIRATKLFKEMFPGIRWDQTTADWRETTIALNQIARQYLGRDVSPRELAMLHSKSLAPTEFERNLSFIGQTDEAMRWAAQSYTPQEKEALAFSQLGAAAIRSRGARAAAMRGSFAEGQARTGSQLVRKKEDSALVRPFI